MTNHPVLLFDGVCNLCNGAVQFIIRRDRAGYFRFASLQSEAGQALLRQFELPTDRFDSFVYVADGRCYTESTAALLVARHLSGAWPLLYGLRVIPRVVRDGVYRWVARNRYRLFGKRDACMLPSPFVQRRFLA